MTVRIACELSTARIPVQVPSRQPRPSPLSCATATSTSPSCSPPARGAILLPDPFSFPTDAVLSELHGRPPGVPVLGGVSSARTLRGEAAPFLGEEVVSGGAIGVRFDGIELLPCVSQGATPIGPELTITAGEGGIIQELAGRPALAALRSVIEELPDDKRRTLAEGMLLGVVVESFLHGCTATVAVFAA